MDVELRRMIDELEQQLGSAAVENTDLRSELEIALERQAVTAQILNVISMSRTDVQPVFDVISESPGRLLGGQTALVTRHGWHAPSGRLHGGKSRQPCGDPGFIGHYPECSAFLALGNLVALGSYRFKSNDNQFLFSIDHGMSARTIRLAAAMRTSAIASADEPR